MFVFEVAVFWAMFLFLGVMVSGMFRNIPLTMTQTKGWGGFARLWAWFAVYKAADVTVTVWAYAHGVGWMEGNPCLAALEGTSDWSIWLVPQFLVGFGGLWLLPGFLAISFWRPSPEKKVQFSLALGLWAWGATQGALAAILPAISWAWALFWRDGYTILP